MKETAHNTLLRVLILLLLLIFMDSCRLFRRREYDNSSASSKVPTPSNSKSYSRTYNSKTINEIVSLARSYTGVPYRSGGTDGNGMDCSGLLYCVYGQNGFKIPRISWQQSEVGREISIDELRAGDWVFFVRIKEVQAQLIMREWLRNLEMKRKYYLYIHPHLRASKKTIYSVNIGWDALRKLRDRFKHNFRTIHIFLINFAP